MLGSWCVLRFLSDGNVVGIGKVGCTEVPEAFLEGPYKECSALEPYGRWACV